MHSVTNTQVPQVAQNQTHDGQPNVANEKEAEELASEVVAEDAPLLSHPQRRRNSISSGSFATRHAVTLYGGPHSTALNIIQKLANSVIDSLPKSDEGIYLALQELTRHKSNVQKWSQEDPELNLEDVITTIDKAIDSLSNSVPNSTTLKIVERHIFWRALDYLGYVPGLGTLTGLIRLVVVLIGVALLDSYQFMGSDEERFTHCFKLKRLGDECVRAGTELFPFFSMALNHANFKEEQRTGQPVSNGGPFGKYIYHETVDGRTVLSYSFKQLAETQ